jgi:hypothetical protein
LFSNHVPSTNRYSTSATLIYPNNIWVEKHMLEAQMWMQQGADGK